MRPPPYATCAYRFDGQLKTPNRGSGEFVECDVPYLRKNEYGGKIYDLVARRVYAIKERPMRAIEKRPVLMFCSCESVSST